MSIISIFLTSLALAMDAFAVSLTIGMKEKGHRIKNAIRVGAYFGIFQGLMPLIGWLLGVNFSDYIIKFDHWIAFILLSIIGSRMIYEAIKGNDEDKLKYDLTAKIMLLLAIATSIDALAIGVSFAFLSVNIVLAVALISIITFATCFFGVIAGKSLGNVLESKAEILGGIILIFIGIKILIEHTNALEIFKSML
ncbi:manganese efflux pump MntP family protein [Clostridium sp. UBA6640]|uniref:manganese efflux pump MntP n=1 Tax=Clostridium sp. UBA6640 TaxID=1946370 RepID=UPI0025BAE853|nr:manganese efflux pump MntP family protein [Clostridium sp. UBA6640]